MDIFRHRLAWTSNWLNVPEPSVDVVDDEFQLVDGTSSSSILDDIISLSDLGHPLSWINVHDVAHDSGYDDAASRYSSQSSSHAYPDSHWSHYTPSESCHFINSDDSANDVTETQTRLDVNSYNLAGRQANHTFQDLRSASKAHGRFRKASYKYYNWRFVKRGQAGALHYGPMPCWDNYPNFVEPQTLVLDKRTLYDEAQRWPRPRKYHYRPSGKDKYPFSKKFERRMELRKKSHFMASADFEDALSCDRHDCVFGCLIDRYDWLADWNDDYVEDVMTDCEYHEEDMEQTNRIQDVAAAAANDGNSAQENAGLVGGIESDDSYNEPVS